ncbi:MAG TPA: hypothetical protein VMI94_14450 [Bryobacteraceae bacterium]|nr:hypothetical protein [Bryobacteraceae bacterium]
MKTVLLITLAAVVLLVPSAIASDHYALNGTWVLVPDRCDFAGQPPLQGGTVTLWYRQHNITVSRTFDLPGAGGAMEYTFGIDGPSGSTIHNGKEVKSKARWEGHALVVTTTEDRIPTVERFRMGADGMLILTVTRPDRPPMTLVFERR